jgi:phosphoribosylglycinamide formyltransferase-1
MRLIGETLLQDYKNRIINIHPSLLPLYKGKDAIGQALLDNATVTGVTVHYVDEGMDTGRIIEQEQIIIKENESRDSLEQRIHMVEHKLYPRVIKKVLEEINK